MNEKFCFVINYVGFISLYINPSTHVMVRIKPQSIESYLAMFHLKEAKGRKLGLKEWYMKRMVRGMSKEEKQSMMEKMMDEFFASMTSEEKKELMTQMMPKMMEKMMEGMTVEDKQELMGSMMPAMMAQMFGGEGGMSSMMMQMMKSMMGGEKEGGKGERPRMPVMEKQEDFKPWEFCPCRKLCEEAFKKKAKG